MDYMDEFQFFSPYMESGEYAVWQGRPERGNYFSGMNWVTALFSLVWLGFSLSWEAIAIAAGAPPVFLLFGLPFIGIGIFLLFGGALRRMRNRGKTLYLITNRRVLIKSGSRVSIYRAEDLPAMQIKLHKNGNGTIIFSQSMHTSRGRIYSIHMMMENLADVAGAQSAVSRMEREQRQIEKK